MKRSSSVRLAAAALVASALVSPGRAEPQGSGARGRRGGKVRYQIGTKRAEATYQVRGGMVFISDDIALGRYDEMELDPGDGAGDPPGAEGGGAGGRSGAPRGPQATGGDAPDLVAKPLSGWSDGVIPYELTADFLAVHDRAVFEDAVARIHARTNLRLVARTDEDTYLSVTATRGDGGCFAWLGRRGRGPQLINIGADCGVIGIVLHEIFHSLGLPHEHQRHDRDEYVRHHPENVEEDRHHAFEVLDADEWDNPFPYDYGSVMHYGRHAFATAPDLVTLDPIEDGEPFKQGIGQRRGISDGDVMIVNYLVEMQAMLGPPVVPGPPEPAPDKFASGGGGGLFGLP